MPELKPAFIQFEYKPNTGAFLMHDMPGQGFPLFTEQVPMTA
jgi:hypothetical protein